MRCPSIRLWGRICDFYRSHPRHSGILAIPRPLCFVLALFFLSVLGLRSMVPALFCFAVLSLLGFYLAVLLLVCLPLAWLLGPNDLQLLFYPSSPEARLLGVCLALFMVSGYWIGIPDSGACLLIALTALGPIGVWSLVTPFLCPCGALLLGCRV